MPVVLVIPTALLLSDLLALPGGAGIALVLHHRAALLLLLGGALLLQTNGADYIRYLKTLLLFGDIKFCAAHFFRSWFTLEIIDSCALLLSHRSAAHLLHRCALAVTTSAALLLLHCHSSVPALSSLHISADLLSRLRADCTVNINALFPSTSGALLTIHCYADILLHSTTLELNQLCALLLVHFLTTRLAVGIAGQSCCGRY